MTRRPLAILPAAILLAATTVPACAPAPAPTDADPTRPAADPLSVCVEVVSYWAGVDLAGGVDVGDYQQRGLSARQDGVRRDIVEQGRAAGGLTDDEIRGRARAGCAELLAADPDPSGF